MATFNLNGYNSYSGCDIVVTARLNIINNDNSVREKVYTLGSIQTLSVSTHQDKKSVRVIGSVNALDYTMGPRTIAGSLVFAVFDQHFATEMFEDLSSITGKTFFLPDELPALDLTISFANEYGRTSRMAIYGVRIINEGQVMSVNDLYTENTYQFVANALEPLSRGTGNGLNSDKTEEVQVSSAIDFDDISISSIGEQIHNYSINTNNENLTRALLTVKVDQPMFQGQDGIATLALSPQQETGVIVIHNQLQDNVEREIYIADEKAITYDVFLEQGLYSAWYENNGKVLSNTAVFSVDRITNYDYNGNNSPNIENITSNSISITSNDITHTTGVCINQVTNEIIEVELISKKCVFKNLSPNTSYIVYTKHNSSLSNSVMCITLEEQQSFVNSFRSYVEYNAQLLNEDVDTYENLLSKLTDQEDIIYTLSKVESSAANELLYMGVKYKNEFNRIINPDKMIYMPTKNLNNIFGNTIIFNPETSKCNTYYIKNKKEYFVESESYPTELTYANYKTKTLYGITSIVNDVKMPKYLFYNFAEECKHKLEDIYNQNNQLQKIDLTQYISKYNRKTDNELKCLAVMNNKNIDIQLLKAPYAYIDKFNNLIADINYRDVLGKNNAIYYLCVSPINESLDKTPFRKIKITQENVIVFANKYETAINDIDVFAIWIEDANFNVISEIGFVSTSDEIKTFNDWLAEEKINKILSNIDTIDQYYNISDLTYSVIDPKLKNLYYQIASMFIDMNLNNLSYYLVQLFKNQFNDYYVNQDKYKKVIYNKSSNKLIFDTSTSSQLVGIRFKKNEEYNIEVFDSNSIIVDNTYDYSLYYMIHDSYFIKSGFVLIDKQGNILNHSIAVEEE